MQQFISSAKARPPKPIRDYLSPTNSHLLSLLLADVLPAQCYPYPWPPASGGGPSSPPAPPPQLPHWGRPLPLGHHLVYFPMQARPSELSADGADEDHAPGPPYVRRLWAGGRMTFCRGWEDVMRLDGRGVVGSEGVGDARVVERGRGDDGMVVVDLKRGYGVEGKVAIEEVRRLVFLREEGAKKGEAPKKAPMLAKEKPDYSVSLTPSPALLFSFSALTYNAHRIHIDPAYAASESHRAMLVHGPLSVVLLLTVLGSRLAPGESVETFDYRNLRPLYVGEELTVCVRRTGEAGGAKGAKGGWEVWIQGPDGGIAVKGTVTTAVAEAARL